MTAGASSSRWGRRKIAGVNGRVELAAVEASWQTARRIEAMKDGATLLRRKRSFFSYDTQLGRDVVVEQNVVFGPGDARGGRAADPCVLRIWKAQQLGRTRALGRFARLRPGAILGDKVKGLAILSRSRLQRLGKVRKPIISAVSAMQPSGRGCKHRSGHDHLQL